MQSLFSPGQTRTADLVVNSHPLYQLSYRGSNVKQKIPESEIPVNGDRAFSAVFFILRPVVL